ncbi:MAG: hypothetical protein ACUVRP_08235 [Chlorobiales bacterium]
MIDQVSASVGLDYELFDRFLLSIAYTRHYYSKSSVQASAFIQEAGWLLFQASAASMARFQPLMSKSKVACA